MTTSAQIDTAPDGYAAQSAGHQESNEKATKSLFYSNTLDTGKEYNRSDAGFMPVLTDDAPNMIWSALPGDKSRGAVSNNTRRMSGSTDTTLESPYHSSAGTSPIDESLNTPDHLLYNLFSNSNNNLMSPLNKHSNNLVASSFMNTDQSFKSGVTYKEFIPNLKPVTLFGHGIADGASQARNFYSPGNFSSAANMSGYSNGQKGEHYWDNHVYTVQFKRAHRYYVLPKSTPGFFTIGSFVKVEADRGEDLGVIIEKVEMESLRSGNVRTRLQNGELKRILYHATFDEIAQLRGKAEEERAIIRIAAERMNLMYGGQLKIVDADYQYDRHKLTIYYESNQRIDFRDFVRDLFTIYKTRIWMEHVTYSFRPNEAAAIALQTGEDISNVTTNSGIPHEMATMQYGATSVYSPSPCGATIGQYGAHKSPIFGTTSVNHFPGVCDNSIQTFASLPYATPSKNVLPHIFANDTFIQPRSLNQYN